MRDKRDAHRDEGFEWWDGMDPAAKWGHASALAVLVGVSVIGVRLGSLFVPLVVIGTGLVYVLIRAGVEVSRRRWWGALNVLFFGVLACALAFGAGVIALFWGFRL